MKTRLLNLLLLGTVVFYSCSKNEANISGLDIGDDEPQPIMIGTTARTSVTVKGSGAVGDVDEDNNVWNGQTVRIYAVNRDSIPETLYDVDDEQETNSPLGYGVSVVPNTAETTESGYIILKNEQQTFYYPRGGEFNFFGFHADDALPSESDYLQRDHYENGSHYVDFTIDGTQDLMIAKGEVNKTLDDPTHERYLFSAQSSRLGYRPTLNFEHQLAQVRFFIKKSNYITSSDTEKAPEEVYVNSIGFSSRTRGKLFFIYPDDAVTGVNKGIVWNEDQNPVYLELKKKNDEGEYVNLNEGRINIDWSGIKTKDDLIEQCAGIPIDSVCGFYHLDGNDLDKPVRVGDCLLVEPGQDIYKMRFDVTQYFDKNGNYVTYERDRNIIYEISIKQTLEAGYRYDIYLVINDIEDIGFNIQAEKWNDAGTIEWDPFGDDEITWIPNPNN